MKKFKFTFFSLLVLFASNCFALNVPSISKYDPRITFAVYNASDVYLVKCKNGYVSMLEFSQDERILNIATGFSDGWEIIERDNYLFIKPKAYVIKQEEQSFTDKNGEQIEFVGSSVIQPNPTDWKTNLIVTTTKRIYAFDLTIEEEGNINYKVQFSYPADIKNAKDAKILAEKKAKEEAEEKESLQTELEKTTVPRNWDYMMHINKNSQTISPDFAYDDGVFTYLGFNNTKTIPSVFLYDEALQDKNKESILNTHIKKDGNYDVLVIHKTAQKILLRSGNKLVGIFNGGYAKNPPIKTHETISKNVEREIIEDDKRTK